MKKAITLFCLVLLALGMGGCTKKTDLTDQTADSLTEGTKAIKETKKTAIEDLEGLIVQDGDNFVLIADGSQIQLASDDVLLNLVDQKVKLSGDYNEDGMLEIEKLEVWQQGRLFHSLQNLYLLLDNGENVVLQGSVVPELTDKYIGRDAKILGKFADENNRKFKVLEYYIQGVKTDVWKEYKNSEFNFAIKYPNGWTAAEEEVEVNGTATNVIFTGDGKEVVLIVQKEIPRPALLEDAIEKKVLPSGLVVNLYHDEDAKDGKSLDKAIFNLPESVYDFYLAGFSDEFNLMFQSIELVK